MQTTKVIKTESNLYIEYVHSLFDRHHHGIVLYSPVRLGASTNTPFSPQFVSLVLCMSDRDPDPNRVMALTP